MADLNITSARIVHSVMQYDVPAGETFAQGAAIGFDANGHGMQANATNATEAAKFNGITTIESERVGKAVTVVEDGLLDVGDALDALDVGAAVFLSDTPGKLADAAGTTSLQVGYVAPAWNNAAYSGVTADKLLRVTKGL